MERKGYVNKEMSINAKIAYKQGLFTLSKLKKKDLIENGFNYPLIFFKWLCKNNFILPSERHHTSATYRLTTFYSTKAIQYASYGLNLNNLYNIYKGKETIESLVEKESFEYKRILVSSTLLGIKNGSNIKLDCVQYKNHLFYSIESAIDVNDTSYRVIKTFKEIPEDWNNKNTCDILKRIIVKNTLRL